MNICPFKSAQMRKNLQLTHDARSALVQNLRNSLIIDEISLEGPREANEKREEDEEEEIRRYPLGTRSHAGDEDRFFGQLNRSHGIAPWESQFGNARIEASSLPGFHPTSESRREGRRSFSRFVFASFLISVLVCGSLVLVFFSFLGRVPLGTRANRREETSEARACSRENSTRARGKTAKARGACRTRVAWARRKSMVDVGRASGANSPPHEFHLSLYIYICTTFVVNFVWNEEKRMRLF